MLFNELVAQLNRLQQFDADGVPYWTNQQEAAEAWFRLSRRLFFVYEALSGGGKS